MAINRWQFALLGGVTIAAAGFGSYIAGAPSYFFEGVVVLSPDDAGGYSGRMAGVMSKLIGVDAAAPRDTGVFDAAPGDAAPRDASLDASLDAGPRDANPADAVASDARGDAALDASIDAAMGDTGALIPAQLLPPPSHHDYSQLQAFSADDQLVLVWRASGYTVMKVPPAGSADPTPTFVRALPAEALAPRWRTGSTLAPSARTIVYQVASPTRLMGIDIDTGTISTLYTSTFPFSYPSRTFEQPSRDGRYWNILAHSGSGLPTLEVIDLNAGTRVFSLPFASLAGIGGRCTAPDYDYVAMSTLGTFALIQWAPSGWGRCQGMEAWSLTTGAYVRHIHDHRQHGDHGLMTDSGMQREFYATSVLASPEDGNRPGLVLEFLDRDRGPVDPQWGTPIWSLNPINGKLESGNYRFIRTMDWGDLQHASCQGNPGVPCVMTAAPKSDTSPNLGWVWAVDLFTGARSNLVLHQSSSAGPSEDAAYWAQSRSSISRSGRLVIYDSDLGSKAGDARPFILRR